MVIDFCAERILYMDNTCFKHKNLHTYIREDRDQNGVELMRMRDLVLVKKDLEVRS